MPIKLDLSKYLNPVFVETGTLHGEGVHAALEAGFSKIISIEVKKEFYENCKKRFAEEMTNKKVSLILGDSLTSLGEVINDINAPITFWLDGHGGYLNVGSGIKYCPLYEERDHISNHNVNSHTIMIDDRRLWGQHEHGWKLINEKILVEKIKIINEHYTFCYEIGHVKDDVLIAKIE